MVSVSKGTAVAAGVGAAVGLANGFTSARYIIKNKDIIQQGGRMASGIVKDLGKNAGPIKKFLVNLYRKNLIDYRKMMITGKISPKYVGKHVMLSALTFTGIYLAYRGIKAGVKKLFASNKAAKVA